MTAAHRTLPFGTVLSVQSGGRSIQVTVTDRGPFTGAFLDLSPAAASALGCRCTHRKRDRDGGAVGIRWNRRRQQRSSRRCGSRAVLPADRGRHASDGIVRIHDGHGPCTATPSSLSLLVPILDPGSVGGEDAAETRAIGRTTCESGFFWPMGGGLRGCKGSF